jgi:hypothetical protein
MIRAKRNDAWPVMQTTFNYLSDIPAVVEMVLEMLAERAYQIQQHEDGRAVWPPDISSMTISRTGTAVLRKDVVSHD